MSEDPVRQRAAGPPAAYAERGDQRKTIANPSDQMSASLNPLTSPRRAAASFNQSLQTTPRFRLGWHVGRHWRGVSELDRYALACMNVLRTISGASREVDHVSTTRRCRKECFGSARFDAEDVHPDVQAHWTLAGCARTFGWSAFALLGLTKTTHNQELEPTGMSASDLPLRRRVVGHHGLPVAQLCRSVATHLQLTGKSA